MKDLIIVNFVLAKVIELFYIIEPKKCDNQLGLPQGKIGRHHKDCSIGELIGRCQIL